VTRATPSEFFGFETQGDNRAFYAFALAAIVLGIIVLAIVCRR